MARNMKCPTTNKDAFFTLAGASKAVSDYRKSRKVNLRTYVCPDCKRWHLTKSGAHPAAAEMFADLPNTAGSV